MPFVIEESWLPAIVTAPPMSDEEFADFCAEHPDLFFEMTAEGELVVMPPNFTLTGIRNAQIVRQLSNWAALSSSGVASDSSTGFVLPSGARRSPDAAWTENGRIRDLDPMNMDRYWHLCPDFVIELRSQSDRLPVLRAKMREWIENGARLGWMIDPERMAVEMFRPDTEPETRLDAGIVEGEGPVAGFALDLAPVWNPLGL